MPGTGSSTLLLMVYPDGWRTGLIIWCVIYILLAYAVDIYCVKQKRGMG